MKRPLMLLSILCMVISVFVHMYKEEAPPCSLSEKQVSLQGRITSIENRNSQTILYLSDVLFYGDSAEEITDNNINGVMCYCDGIHELKLGQTVVVQGFLSLQKQSGNEGEFDALAYYSTKGYEYSLKDADILKTGEKYDLILNTLYVFKNLAKQQLYIFLEQEDAGIMTALLLGDKSGIATEVREAYRSAGIYHILAISGLHISMIGGWIFRMLKKLRIPSPVAAIIGIGIILLYGMMIGMPSSAFRAIIMFAMGVVAGVINRTHDRPTSLALAAACLLTGNPLLIGDAGFLLSFLAVMGILCLYPTFTSLHHPKMPLADGLWVSFSVTYFTLPVVMYFYYEVPVYSIFLNCVILPFLPLLLLLGIIIIFLGNLLPAVAHISSVGIHLVLFFYEKMLQLFAKLPGGNYVSGAPSLWKIILFYVLVLGMIYIVLRQKRKLYLYSLESENDYYQGHQDFYIKKQKEIRKNLRCLRIIQTVVMILGVAIIVISPKAELTITFLDVGQGDGICIETPDKTFFIDGGSVSNSNIGTYTLIPFWKYSGIKKIDGWFLTHSDYDHVSAFKELCGKENMGGISVDTLYLPKVLEQEFEEVICLARQQDINVVFLERNEELIFDELKFQVLSPDSRGFYQDENSASLVLYLEYGQFDCLFMGDAGIKAEELIIEEGIEEIILLKVAHHGSGINTNSEAFIEEVSPKIAVISCGENNSYGHPHQEVLESLEECDSAVYRTDLGGQISILLRRGKIYVERL